MSEVVSKRLETIPLSKIVESTSALRGVDRSKVEYAGLVDSIRKNGVLNSISVREIKDKDTGEILYGLVDGLQRFSASKDAGKDSIPAQILNMSDSEVLEAQIITNIHKIETLPYQYSKALKRLLQFNVLMTIAELSERLSRSPTWIRDRLDLTKLPENIGKLVDEGKICLNNGYPLARLAAVAPDEVSSYLDRAMTMSPVEFMPIINDRIKEVKDAARQGRDTTPATFEPHPLIRKSKEMQEELATNKIGPVLVHELKVKDPKDAFRLGVQWALQIDPPTRQLRIQKEEARKAKLDAENEAKKKARAEEKLKKAQEEVASLPAIR